ncbi:MAG: FAD:protein FMN transferase [Elusimicrobia bacterium]|nr:FAD:protein FMN transferase [Elusimicrobiota bacterium]
MSCHKRKIKNLKSKIKSIVLLLLLLITGCAQPPAEVYGARVMLGTVVEIKIIDPDPRQAEIALEDAFREIKRIEKLMSHFDRNSALSQLNRQGYSADKELYALILKAVEISQVTNGGFDITVGPLMNLWDFKAQSPRVPTTRQIRQALKNVGYKKINIDSQKIKIVIKEGIDIDLGGIAKGYAVDQALEVLIRQGIHTALINAGGDIRVVGNKEWRIGLKNPRGNEILAAIIVKSGAVVTSGDYERYFIKEGKRYHHILNPGSGYPADQCQSVTVIAPTAAAAVALAKGIFVAGPEKGLKLTATQPKIESIIIDNQGRQHVSRGLIKKGNTYWLKTVKARSS